MIITIVITVADKFLTKLLHINVDLCLRMLKKKKVHLLILEAFTVQVRIHFLTIP